jgi:hypothetical protein
MKIRSSATEICLLLNYYAQHWVTNYLDILGRCETEC